MPMTFSVRSPGKRGIPNKMTAGGCGRPGGCQMIERFVSGFVVLLLAAGALFAQSGPDNDPSGLQGIITEPFVSSNPDAIDLFNGQLTVPIAVGNSYPIGPSLRFQLMLTYNSRVWELGHPIMQSPDFAYTPITGNPALGIGWN